MSFDVFKCVLGTSVGTHPVIIVGMGAPIVLGPHLDLFLAQQLREGWRKMRRQ
jgi:hypothetical protein